MKTRFFHRTLSLVALALGATLLRAQTFPSSANTTVAVSKNDATGNLTASFNLGAQNIVLNGAGNITVSGAGNNTATAVKLRDTDASHTANIVLGSNLTGNRTLTLTPGDADRTLTLTGNATVNQDTSTTGSPTWVNATLSGMTANTLIYVNGTKTSASVTLSGLTLSSGTLSVDAATTSAAGKVAIATSAETITGTSTTKAVTPAGFQAGVAPLRNGLAPRQGLAFAGSAGAVLANGPTLGTSAWSVGAMVRVAANKNYNGILGAESGGLWIFTDSGGALHVGKRSDSDSFAAFVDLGEQTHLLVTNDGTTLTVYKNGISFATSTSINVIASYTGAQVGFGSTDNGNGDPLNGAAEALVIYNRALSAAEVLALYESGAPAAADFNNASNTSLNLAAFVNAVGGNAYDSFSAASASGFTAIKTTPGQNAYVNGATSLAWVYGRKYRFEFTVTLNSGTAPNIVVDGGGLDAPVVNGQNVFDLVPTATLNQVIQFWNAAGQFSYYSISNFKVTPLGLLCAPESTAPGKSYQWRSASGQSPPADITLPASGVSWTLVDSNPNSVRATLTWAGTHEAKSLLGQVAIPSNAVITSITTTASAGSAGAGMTIGSVTTPNLFVTAAAYTTAKKVQALAAQLPAGTATNDLSIVVDPDDQNYTGTIQVSINYVLAQ